MKRVIWLIFIALLSSAGCFAQALSTTDISISPSGAAYSVDGNVYITPQVFVWPTGSKHIVQFILSTDNTGTETNYQSAQADNIRYTFGGWTASNGLLTPATNPVITVTADPSLTSLVGNVSVSFKVLINFPNGTTSPILCTSSGAPGDAGNNPGSLEGVMYLDGQCYSNSTNVFMTAGAHTLNAFPYPGWVFYGFLINSLPPAALISYDFEGPSTITPLFSVAKRVNFITSPLGLNILIDGSPVPTPNANSASSSGTTCAPDYTRLPSNAPPGITPLCIGQFDFLPGSTHHIGAPPSQMDALGNLWNFSGFSNGLGQNAVYVVPYTTGSPDVITANFVPGVQTAILSQPQGMKIQVDGRDNWPSYLFVWGTGETHSINAESPQTDAKGRVWTFASWSDGGAQSHNITVLPGATGMVVTANYTSLEQVTISSTPGSLNFTVDGAPCVTPCVINKSSGSTSQVVAPATVPAGPGARFTFVSWSDGVTTPGRNVNFTQDTLALTATYQMSFLITAVSNPATAGTFTLVPPSPDGFYLNGTQVAITAAANSGFKFAHWEGDLSGSFASGSLLMSSAHTVQADFGTVPYIPPTGIESVTGPTPDGSVAAGSIISIYGQNLAPGMLVGPTNPLAQTLNNVTVTVNGSLLPLVFVSPGQISAQVPWEFTPGNYTLVVHQTGLPDVPGSFTVTRNAPGAFTQGNSQNLPLVLAIRSDGSVLSFANPAQQGEQITIYATGLGPYAQPAVDGFPAVTTNFDLVDPVTLNTDSAQLQPDWAGGAVGIVGVQAIKLTITSDLPPSSNVTLTINANGKNSAQIVLPIQ